MASNLAELYSNPELSSTLREWAKSDITKLVLAGAKESCLQTISNTHSAGDCSDSFALGVGQGYSKAVFDLESLTTAGLEDTEDPLVPSYNSNGGE